MINLPESVVAGTHYTQERFIRALATFRELNTEDETVLNYFDEAEIHPLHIGMLPSGSQHLVSCCPLTFQAAPLATYTHGIVWVILIIICVKVRTNREIVDIKALA